MSCKEQIVVSKTSTITESVAQLEDNSSQDNSDSDDKSEGEDHSLQDLTYEEPTNNEASSVSKTRRLRSPNHERALAPSNMTLRKKSRPNYA